MGVDSLATQGWNPNPALPAYAKTAARVYDRERGLYGYGMDNTQWSRVGRGKAVAGTGWWDIACLGDSLGLYNGVTYQSGLSFPWLMRDIIASRLAIPKRPGIIPTSGMQDLNTYAAPMTTVGNSIAFATGAGGTCTVAVPACTSISVLFLKANQATTTFTIDGGAANNMIPVGGAGFDIVTVSGLADAPHSVVISSAAGTSEWGCVFATGGTSGIRVHNLHLTGTNASLGTAQLNWSNTAVGSILDWRLGMLQVCAVSPQTFIVQLGTNDPINGATSASAVAAGMTAIYNKIKSVFPNSDVFFVAVWSGSTVAVTLQQAIAGAYFTASDSLLNPVMNWYDRVISQAAGFASGLIGSDGLHAAAAGSEDFALAFAGVLLD